MEEMGRKLIMMVAVMLFVFTQVAYAADLLSVQVNCQGCSSKAGIPGGYQFNADVGKTITLTAFSTGGVGNKCYEWTKEGRTVCDSASFLLIVAEDAEYILTVTDDAGSVSKLVKIVSRIPKESKCLPSFKTSIAVKSDISGKTEYSAGESFTVKVRLDTRDCPSSNYRFYWRADDENIIFVNPNSTATEVRIGQGIKSGKVKIEAIVTDGVVTRSRQIEIKIVKNTPPQFEIGYSKPVYSYTWFNVHCIDFESGEYGDEDNDFLYKCSVVLRNEKGEIVSSSTKIARYGKVSSFRLKPGGIGIKTIELTAWDSHKASTTKNETICVVKGNTGKDVPIVRASDTVYCIVGEVCVIDASATDRDVSSFRFYNADTEEQLANPKGNYCSGPVCNHNFTYPGTYRIRIEANYFNQDNTGYKIVTVVVNPSDTSVTSDPTPTPIPQTETISPSPRQTFLDQESTATESADKIPGMEVWTAIIMIIAAIVFKRRKQ